MVADRTSWSG